MRILLLSLLLLTAWAGEAEPVKLPADVQTVIDKATAAETTAQNEADAKILKVRQTLIKDLTKLQETYTKKGNLDAANGIKSIMNKLNEEVTKQMLDDEKNRPRVSTSKFVTLYPLPDFKGSPAIIKDVGNIIDWNRIPFPNDGLRSARVPVGYTLTVFPNELGGGASVDITEDTANITGVAMGMSSIIVKVSPNLQK